MHHLLLIFLQVLDHVSIDYMLNQEIFVELLTYLNVHNDYNVQDNLKQFHIHLKQEEKKMIFFKINSLGFVFRLPCL